MERDEAAFVRMKEAARVLFADPANPEKIAAAREATEAFRAAMADVSKSAGFPKHIADGWDR
jgi:hypothetical protein